MAKIPETSTSMVLTLVLFVAIATGLGVISLERESKTEWNQ